MNKVIDDEIVRYSPLKESRNQFYIEYYPPNKGCRFACLQLIYINDNPVEKTINEMEEESKTFLNRFPIPIMVSAFDDKGDLIKLEKLKPQDYLIAFRNDKTNITELHWENIGDNEIPDIALNSEYCNKIYHDFPRINRSKINQTIKKDRRIMKTGLAIIITWAVIIPALILIVEFFFPTWLSAIVLGYSLMKALIQALKMLGKIKPSAKEKEENNENALKEHHHYYCLKNPDGFSRLKIEVIEKEEREAIRKEAEKLKNR
jgi:hypothetical protein